MFAGEHSNSNFMMNTIQLDGGTDSLKSSELASDIIEKKSTILQLAENLEPLIISPDLNKRIEGLDVLASVLEVLPEDFLSPHELLYITKFFCSHLTFHHSILSVALKAIKALIHKQRLPPESLHHITSTLFNSVVWQTQTLSDRRVFYTILQFIVFNHIKDHGAFGTSPEFLYSVLSSVDGERDPRNLLLIFSFLPKLYSFMAGSITEDAFEAASCYFPIDFHPSAAEPGDVTREELVSALTPCLLAVPDFARFSLPLIEEKLESTLKSARIDCYNLLVEGCKVWPVVHIVTYSKNLWLAIKQDTLPPRDAQTADCATKALEALVRALPEPDLTVLLTSVIRSCEGFLTDVQLSMFEPASRLLLAAMQASTPACIIVSHKILPGLVSLLEVTQETSQQLLIITKLTSFIQVCLLNIPDIDSEGEALGTWKVWGGLHYQLKRCTEQGQAAVCQVAYTALAMVARQLGADCRQSLYSTILAHLTTQQPTLLRSACSKCLLALARLHGDEVQANIVENLITQGDEEESICKYKFETVCTLAVIERFHTVFEQQFTSLVAQDAPYISVAISCLRNVLEVEEVQSTTSLVQFLFSKSTVLPTLMRLKTDGDELINSSKIIQILVQLQDSSEQLKVVQPFAESLLECPNQTQQMVLLEALVVPLYPQVRVLSLEQVSRVVMPAALHCTDSKIRISALHILANLVNKATDDELLELVSEQLKLCSVNQATMSHAYITKALVLRSHPQMEHWLNKLLDLLDDKEAALTAAEGVQLILDDTQTFLSHQNHCIVKLLYRQRLFHLIVPRLVKSSGNVEHLKSLAYLLQAVPHPVYMHHIDQMMPLLVKSLDMDNEGLLLTILRTLASLLATSDSHLEAQVDTFLPRFLHLATHSSFMQVRVAALKCLANSLKYSPILLLPRKQEVLSGLVPCLDDRKRLVRKEAARTRSKWFLLGAPSSDP